MRFCLVQTATHLELQDQEHPEYTPLFIDFNAGKAKYRREHRGSELLLKALGKNKTSRTIIDATAGLGRDAFVLACAGYSVMMLERSPIIGALLVDALQRAAHIPDLIETVQRLTFTLGDATEILKTQTADIIYLDPMFPKRKKTAAVKKEMVILQDLLTAQADDTALLPAALNAARHRVIVKRPLHAPALTEAKPDLCYKGKASRFDVYLSKIG
jgi:16S rRNA (guanine1516-N2)-methyltransferase